MPHKGYILLILWCIFYDFGDFITVSQYLIVFLLKCCHVLFVRLDVFILCFLGNVFFVSISHMTAATCDI